MAGDMSQLLGTKLGQAIQRNNLDELKLLLESGEDPHYRDKRNNTYLHFACSVYCPQVVSLLLAQGIELNAQNKAGNTPLHISALSNECDMVAPLMTAGIDPFIRNHDGKIAMEIEAQNKWWLECYKIYEPGMFACVEAHDIPKFLELISKWCRVDAVHHTGKTLRQYAAQRSYHDMVTIIDKNSHTLDCIYGIQEEISEKVYRALKKSICQVNFVNMGIGKEHILQYALDLNHLEYVEALCDAGADVNLPVRIKKYFKGPLYFEVIRKRDVINPKIIEKVLESSIDVTAKDERGRSPLIFAVDTASNEMLKYIVDFLIEHGVEIAARDNTGATARDVAKLAGKKTVVEAIDRAMIRLIRCTDTDSLWKLAVAHYDDFMFEYRYKDTWIYAAGNESETATRWLQGLDKFRDDVKQLHEYIRTNNVGMTKFLLRNSPDRDRLLIAQDRGGRTPLIIAVMCGWVKFVTFLLENDPELVNQGKDNMNRTALHYAYALGESGKNVVEILQHYGADETAKDVLQKFPKDYQPVDDESQSQLLEEEKERSYGMETEMYFLKVYDQLKHIIHSKDDSQRKYKEFLKAVRGVWYPMSAIPSNLNPNGIPLAIGFKDLIFHAIEKREEDIVKKLIFMGADTDRKEKISLKRTNQDGSVHHTHREMTATEYAEHLHWPRMAEYIRSHRITERNKVHMFNKTYWVNVTPGTVINTDQPTSEW